MIPQLSTFLPVLHGFSVMLDDDLLVRLLAQRLRDHNRCQITWQFLAEAQTPLLIIV